MHDFWDTLYHQTKVEYHDQAKKENTCSIDLIAIRKRKSNSVYYYAYMTIIRIISLGLGYPELPIEMIMGYNYVYYYAYVTNCVQSEKGFLALALGIGPGNPVYFL